METGEKKFDGFEELVLELGMARIFFAEEEEEEEEARIVVSIKDITERKQAEEALRESEEKYRNIFNDAILGIYQTTPKGRIVSANPALARMCGYDTPEELTNNVTATQMYANPEDREIFKGILSKDGVVEKFETRFRKRSGEIIWVLINAHTVKDGQGNITHYEGTIEDITERKRAEEELRASEENFRRSLDDSPLGVRIVTIEGETLYTNRAMLNIYGYDSIEELRTTPVKKRYIPDSYGEFQKRKKKRQQGEYDPFEYEVSIVRKNGEVRHLQVFRKEILWNGERQFQTIYQDITARKLAEDNLKSSLLEKEILLKEIHHRVKNNLTVISSIMGLQSRYMKDDTSREIFRECENRVRTMAMIHTKLYQSKDFAHIEFGFYIKELAHDLFYSYGADPDAITLNINVADIPIDINTAIPLGLLLNELLSNAIKYAFPEGRKGEIIVTLHAKDGNIILTIADDGIGFPETIDFRDTQSLGLQLVMALIQQLDATIELMRDKGTIFTITFWKEGG